MLKPILYLIRGVSGAGKSTFAQRLWEAGVVDRVFEADDWFYSEGEYKFDATKLHEAHNVCQHNTYFTLKAGKSVAVSNTSTTEKEVQAYKEIAELVNAHFISVIVENRHGGENVHNVPPEKIQQMKNRFSIKL